MKTEILKTEEGFKKLWNDWNELLGRSGLNVIFLTHEWLSAWWEEYGRGHQLFIVIVKEGQEMKAIAPLMVKNIHIGKINIIRKLQFIAHDISDYMDFIVTERKEECFNLIFDELVRCRYLWDWAEFVYIQETSPNYVLWEQNIRKHMAFKKFFIKDCVSVVLDLFNNGKNWQEYENTISKKKRNDIKRCEKLLKQKGDIIFNRTTKLSEINEMFPIFVDIHKRKWRFKGKGSQFDDYSVISHYLNIIEKLSRHGWIELSTIKINDKYIAISFGYLYNNRYYYYTPAFNPDYWRYSPGNLLIRYLIESFYENGNIKVFDLLRGDEPYKYVWSKEEEVLYRIKIFPNKIKAYLIYIFDKYQPIVMRRLSKSPLIRYVKHLLLKIKSNID